MSRDADRDPARARGARAGMSKPHLAALGFLAAFALSTLTLIYTGLLVRAPDAEAPDAEVSESVGPAGAQQQVEQAPVSEQAERGAEPEQPERDAEPEPAERDAEPERVDGGAAR